MVKVYLSLGSNLGDRESNLAQATMALSVEPDIFNIERASENKNSSPAQFLELREELSKSLNAEKYYVEV